MASTNAANGDRNPGEPLELFPSETKDTPPQEAVRTSPKVTPPDADLPIAFESVPIAPLLIAADSYEPPPRTTSRRIAQLERSVREWQQLAADAFALLPRFPSGVKGVRGSLWPFAVGVLAGIVAVSALRSDDPSTKISADPQVSQTPVVASVVPQLAIVEGIADTTPAPQVPAAIVEKPTPPPMPQRSQARRPVSATRFRGHLIVDSEPRGASVMINQRLVGTTPLELSRYPASSYAVRVQQDGYQRWSAGVLVPADKVTRVHARLQRIP